jgi:hypothetical protein
MLARILSGFTDCNPAVGLDPIEKVLEAPFIDFRVGIQEEDEFRLAQSRKAIHTTRKSVIPS